MLQRDVGIDHPPLVTEEWIAACFTPDEKQTPANKQALAYSDAAISELSLSDIIVIATPRYNYGMPAALKAWFDQVIRIRRTFSFDPAEKTWPLSPILHGKKLILISASGEFDFHPGGIREDWDHLEPHVRTCAHYIGVASADIHHVSVEYQEFADERHDSSVKLALEMVGTIVDKLTLPLAVPY